MDQRIIIASLCFLAVSAVKGSIPVTLEATPNKEVEAEQDLKLTCSFKVNKDDFQEAVFTTNDKEVITFNGSTTGDLKGIKNYKIEIADDPSAESSIWIIIKGYCFDNSAEQTFKCQITTADPAVTGEATAAVSYADTKKKINISINGGEICIGDSNAHSINSKDILNKLSSVQFSTLEERSAVTGVTFMVEDKSFEPWAAENNADVCAFGAVVGGVYKFTKMEDYSITYVVTTDPDVESTGTCTLTIVDESLTTAEPTTVEAPVAGNHTMDSTQSEPMRLYGSTMAFIIMMVALALLGMVGLWHVYLAKHGRAAPPPLTATKGIESA